MSFLAPSQRGYDSLAHSDLGSLSSSHSNSRHHMHPLPPFDNSPLHLPSISTTPVAPPAPDRSPIVLPKLGQARCYWSLLTPDLHFLYLDPVFAGHLYEQAGLLVGKSLLSFVHPDEQASAKLDLGSVLESRTLHGSVTRVRFSRMSRVRRQLGYQGPLQEWADSDRVAVDDNYMAVDIVINWAADGLVLCFMHAVVDLSTRDNDEHSKTNWTNWCGTPYMSMDQAQLLYQRLLSAVPQPNTMSRVFQILLNQSERSLWMSWPPEREQGGPTSKDFAKLAQDVQIDSTTSGGTDAKTSCTRRYKALQVMPYGANGPKEVESIFILHGSIIFACHKVNDISRPAMSSNNAIQQPGYSSHSYAPQAPQYYDQPSHSYSLPPVPAPPSYNGSYASQAPHPSSSQYSSSSWSHHSEPSQSQYGQWSQSNSYPASSVSSVRSSSYSAPQPQHHWSSQPPSYLDTSPTVSSPPFGQQLPSPNVQYSGSGSGNERTSPSPGSDIVPASRTQRRGSASTREQYGNGGRSSGNPPVGISKCSSCKVTHSPEWRKGPSGKKDLCNACGLRYARSRAKKEGGGLSQRRRKDRTLSAMSSKGDASPSASPVSGGYSNLRRASQYDDNSFVSNSSAGSPSGSEMYAQHPGPGFGHMTPSPSPPSPNPPYNPYSQPSHGQPSAQSDHRSHFGTFYSVPPPAPPALQHMSNNRPASNIPRLEPIMPYSGRMSPLASPSSPASDSPLSGSLSVASFERDKDRERVMLPPTPVSAEPRHLLGKASFMTQ